MIEGKEKALIWCDGGRKVVSLSGATKGRHFLTLGRKEKALSSCGKEGGLCPHVGGAMSLCGRRGGGR